MADSTDTRPNLDRLRRQVMSLQEAEQAAAYIESLERGRAALLDEICAALGHQAALCTPGAGIEAAKFWRIAAEFIEERFGLG